VKRLNEMTLEPGDTDLQARIASYELAFRMQTHAPEAVDLSKETEETKKLYGLDDPKTLDFGTRLLLARRLSERGVRFVQVYSGGGPLSFQWDAHDDINSNHEKMAGHADKPIAALLTDLKRRGLLKDTLVVWCSEFGRTPNSQGSKGRDHNPLGYTMWFAGGGTKGGTSVGETDEFGLKAIRNRISVNDFHATLLHLLGLDHEKLTVFHGGRDERLTDVAGRVVEDVLA
jgi:arylsulfatase A-like enzyme